MKNKAPAADQGRDDGERRGKAQRRSPQYIAVGRRLSLLRKAYDLTQGQIAAAVKVDRTSWNKFENGEQLIPAHNALSVCRHIGVSMDYIYRGLLAGVREELARRLAELYFRD